ncbi:MAG: hypothetical protein HGA85_05555 [Nanoarchaeota archaeon]|nr:hypothetical protein [Nanoarchaeota archaeon]
MRQCDLIDKPLPDRCTDIVTMTNGSGCEVSFRNMENLFQDTDGTVYCHNCSTVIGVYPIGKVPFRRRDDNVLP